MIYNCTPHPINIYKESDVYSDSSTRKLIVRDGAIPIVTIEPSGYLLSAQISYDDAEPDTCVTSSAFVPLKRMTFTGIDVPSRVIPEWRDGDAVIASALYASAAKLMVSNILTVGAAVYENPTNPRPVGCLYLIKN